MFSVCLDGQRHVYTLWKGPIPSDYVVNHLTARQDSNFAKHTLYTMLFGLRNLQSKNCKTAENDFMHKMNCRNEPQALQMSLRNNWWLLSLVVLREALEVI